MAKLVAFIGSPSSGKTTLALKTAMAAYMDKRTKNSRIVFLSPDINVPSVAVLFPNYVPDEICSLGAILDNTDISADMILKNIVTVKTMKDFGCLGFKSGESKFSYVITHTMPKEMILRLGKYPDAHDMELTGFLEWVMYEVDFRHWYCGHWHEDRDLSDNFTMLFYDIKMI